jgi:predicted O-methyltransferase YrrM
MLKRFLSLIILVIIPAFLSAYELPTTVDFGQFPNMQTRHNNTDSYSLGCNAFNYAPEITPLFAYLKREYHIDTAVETGTCRGFTTILFSFLFEEVHTIEKNPDFYNLVKPKLDEYSNIRIYFGSSEKVLQTILPSLAQKPILFYLDAHWQSYWPLLDELEEISKTHKDNCIIVIDDFQVPGRADIPYDAYGSQKCCFEYVKDKLNKIFTSFTVHYVIPKSVKSRAKLIVIPNRLKGE